MAAVVDIDTYILGKDRDETEGEQRKPGELDVHHFVERKPIDQKEDGRLVLTKGRGGFGQEELSGIYSQGRRSRKGKS